MWPDVSLSDKNLTGNFLGLKIAFVVSYLKGRNWIRADLPDQWMVRVFELFKWRVKILMKLFARPQAGENYFQGLAGHRNHFSR